MTTKYESADLILKLYDLRREEKLREAREWFLTAFHPESAQEVLDVWSGPASAPYRMVTTYWNMAASLVNNGAIDPKMFADANTEHFTVFAKLQPFLAEVRAQRQNPGYLRNLERVILDDPNAEQRLAATRRFLEARKAQADARRPAKGMAKAARHSEER